MMFLISGFYALTANAETDQDTQDMEKFLATAKSISEQCKAEHKDKEAVFQCEFKAVEKLAEKGDYMAQYFLAMGYEEEKRDNAQTIKWLKAGIDNPKTPPALKEKLQSELRHQLSKQ